MISVETKTASLQVPLFLFLFSREQCFLPINSTGTHSISLSAVLCFVGKVTGGCELPHVASGNQTQVFCKNKQLLLTTEPSLQQCPSQVRSYSYTHVCSTGHPNSKKKKILFILLLSLNGIWYNWGFPGNPDPLPLPPKCRDYRLAPLWPALAKEGISCALSLFFPLFSTVWKCGFYLYHFSDTVLLMAISHPSYICRTPANGSCI